MQNIGPSGKPAREVTANRGVKLVNKNAKQKEAERLEMEEYRQKFERTADQIMEQKQQSESKITAAVTKFMLLARDKTITQNKGRVAESVETEIRQELIAQAIDLNNDENEPDNGKGSLFCISILLKVMLMYRDRINDLEYKVEKLEKAQKKNEG